MIFLSYYVYMNNKIKGDLYETFICNYLNNLNNTQAFLWNNVPEQLLFEAGLINDYNRHRLIRKKNNKMNPLQDVGIDILLIEKNNISFVQCKNYTNTIPLCDLAGFFMIMAKYIYVRGCVYYTSKLSSKIIEYIGDDTRIKLIKKSMARDEKIKVKDIILYDYQTEIVNLYVKYYETNTKAILSMPCGTGKTIISCHIAKKYNKIIFISPLKQFAEQNIARLLQYDNEIKCLLIDSDGERDKNIIEKFIKDNTRCLLSVTYASCDVIHNCVNDAFIIIDEFHNLSRTNLFDKNDNINKIINSDNKILYMSATPRIYELEDDDNELYNEEFENIFGKTIYKMDFKTAIKNKYICDYKIYLPIILDKDYDELKNDISKEIKINNIANNKINQCCFLFEAIKNLGMLKCIIYFKNCQEIDEFIKILEKINEYYAYDYYINSITYKDNKKERNEKIEKFSSSNITHFLCSVDILNECIDIPKCNTVYITYNCKSKISCIQRMCRSMRIDQYNSNKVSNILLFCEEIDEVLTFISSIKELDLNFNEKINYLSYCKKLQKIIDITQTNITLNEKFQKKFLNVKEYIGVSWDNIFEKVKVYINTHHKIPSHNDKNNDTKKLCNWIQTQKIYYKKKIFIMQNKEVRYKWEMFISENYEYFNVNYCNWNKSLEQVKKYIDDNHKKPSPRDENENIRVMGIWMGTQQKSYNKKNNIMQNDNIIKKWEEFVNEYKKYFYTNDEMWVETLEKVKNFLKHTHNLLLEVIWHTNNLDD